MPRSACVSIPRRLIRTTVVPCSPQRGFVSHGMVLCAHEERDGSKVVEFAEPPADSKAGDRLTCAGFEGEADAVVNPMKKNNPWTAVVDVCYLLLPWACSRRA